MKIKTLAYAASVILACATLILVGYTINNCYATTLARPTTNPSKEVTATDNIYNSQDEPTTKPDKVIYLTFDDGPCIYTGKLLDILDKYNVKATFFVVGNNGSYSIIKDAASRGHTIGLHSYCHKYEEIYKSKDAYMKDLNTIQNIVYASTGQKSYIVRFPGGSSNRISASIKKGIMTELAKTLTAEGYRYFDWNVDSCDGTGQLKREQIVANVVAGIKKHNTSIVLQHDIWPESVYAVEDIIKWGLANGYSFAPITMDSFDAHHVISN